MLSGEAFFCDRDEGLIWCDSCVPTQVVHLAGGRIDGRVVTRPSERYLVVETGELLVSPILPRNATAKRLRARCHECGAVQPLGAMAAADAPNPTGGER